MTPYCGKKYMSNLCFDIQERKYLNLQKSYKMKSKTKDWKMSKVYKKSARRFNIWMFLCEDCD